MKSVSTPTIYINTEFVSLCYKAERLKISMWILHRPILVLESMLTSFTTTTLLFLKTVPEQTGCVQEQRRSLFSIDWVILLYQFTGVVFRSSTFKNIPFTFYSTLWLCNVSFHFILLSIKLIRLMSSPGWARWTTGFTSSGLLKAPCIFEFELFWRTANFER